MMSYYDILGIAPNADGETIRSAFRTLARRYHPDAGAGSSAERFRQIVEAYETLIDPVLRERYDLSLRRVREPLMARRAPFIPVEPLRPPPFYGYTAGPDLAELLDDLLRTFDDFFGPGFLRR